MVYVGATATSEVAEVDQLVQRCSVLRKQQEQRQHQTETKPTYTCLGRHS